MTKTLELWEMTAADVIAALQQNGWTLDEIAAEIDSDRASVSRWRHAARTPRESTTIELKRLAKKHRIQG